MERHQIEIGETIATVIVDKEFIPLIEKAVLEAREHIQRYIFRHPEFFISHYPVDVEPTAPDIIQRMASAGQQMGVGPMASVAGAIAEYVVDLAISAGVSHIIFDNGGDIAMFLEHSVVVGIYAGSRGLQNLGLKITQTKTKLGLCTSSATVGHSLSYGATDASIIYSADATLADAAATALGNAVTSNDARLIESSLKNIIRDGIDGAIIFIDESIGACGQLPQLVHANVDFQLISKGGNYFG